MTTFTSHPYSGNADYLKLRAFLVEARQAGGHCAVWHIGDLAWRLFLQSIDGDPCQNLRLWESASGEVLGFSGYYLPRAFDLLVHPNAAGELRADMLDWVEARWKDVSPRSNLVTDSGFFETDLASLSLLHERGFRQTGNNASLMLSELDDRIPAAVVPSGFCLRLVEGSGEAEERSAAHRDAFSSKRLTPERYLQLRSLVDFVPELDVVAVSPQGQIASYALGWLDRDNAVGEFEPVGTRPAYRRLGLSKAVLNEGMHRMRSMGARQVVVGPVEPDLVPFYESAGFRVIGRTLSFEKVAIDTA